MRKTAEAGMWATIPIPGAKIIGMIIISITSVMATRIVRATRIDMTTIAIMWRLAWVNYGPNHGALLSWGVLASAG